jgi:hypothetical protein
LTTGVLIVPLVVRIGFGVVEIDVYVDGAVVVTGNEMTANDIQEIRNQKLSIQKNATTTHWFVSMLSVMCT